MLHGADGAILDVGRKTRTVPPALRRALQARDRQCRFPGCNARRCDAAFFWPDGRPFPDVATASRWTGLPLAPTDARLNAADIEIGPDTATPDWHGERLDLGYAIDVLWKPRTDSGAVALVAASDGSPPHRGRDM